MTTIDEELRRVIHEEVEKQTTGVVRMVSLLTQKFDRIDKWCHALWGNGSGPPGFLENRCTDEDKRYNDLYLSVTLLRDRDVREDARVALQEELNVAAAQIQSLAETRKTSRLNRLQLWVAIACAVGGGLAATMWTSALRPLIHLLVDHLEAIVKTWPT